METSFFGLRLKELRVAAGLTQPGLADKAGMSKGGIADLEQGINQPSWETVQRLARALNISCEAFQQAPADEAGPTPRGRPSKSSDPEPATKKRRKAK